MADQAATTFNVTGGPGWKMIFTFLGVLFGGLGLLSAGHAALVVPAIMERARETFATREQLADHNRRPLHEGAFSDEEAQLMFSSLQVSIGANGDGVRRVEARLQRIEERLNALAK